MPTPGFQSAAAREFPPIVILNNTSVCNLRCVHCPQGQGYTDRPDYEATYMAWDIFTKAMDEIAENEITMLRFASDGEPLIHPEGLDQIAYAKMKGIGPVDLTTNGVLLDNPAIVKGQRTGQLVMERLLEIGIDVIDISLDALTKETYDRVRVGSDYHRVWSNVHRLIGLRDKLRSPTKIMVSIVDQQASHEEVQRFVDYWTPLVDRVLVRTYQEILGLSPKREGVVLEQVRRRSQERWPCPQFWKRVTISPKGDIRFCVADWLSKSSLGNIATHRIKDVWKSAEYERMRGCALRGEHEKAHAICGPCSDWRGMRWEWGFEVALHAVLGTTVEQGGGGGDSQQVVANGNL